MRKRAFWAGAAVVSAAMTLMATPARASGDYGCTQEWRLGGPPSTDSYGSRDCGNRPLFWPGNDTRSNMFLLLRGGKGLAVRPRSYSELVWEERSFGHSFFSWGGIATLYRLNTDASQMREGSRCDSLTSGAQAFIDALAASRALPAQEREALAKAREGIGGNSCNRYVASATLPEVGSTPGKAFLAYLQGANAFYAGDWDNARGIFTRLKNTREPWVAETAAYMMIRVELNAAQQPAFDDYGYLRGAEAVDPRAVASTRAAIDAYLKRYPTGRYAASAQGLKRRTAWIGGDMAELARLYEAALAETGPDGAGAADLIQEIDNKLLWAPQARTAVGTPLLLATLDLARMREDAEGKPLTAAELAGHQRAFAAHPELYTYLRAARALYVDRDAKAVLALVPAQAPRKGMTPLAYSIQGLRGIALAQVRDPGEEAHWSALIAAADAPYVSEFAQFGLALLWQRGGRLPDVFAPASPITDGTVREILLSRVAGADLLRAAIADKGNSARTRALALFTLLHKDLAQGQFADFGRDRLLLPAGAPAAGYPSWIMSSDDIPTGLFASGKWREDYACPTIETTARTLAARPGDAQARLCLGDFWRLNSFDNLTVFTPFDDTDMLGGGHSLFPGKTLTRASLYTAVIADPRAGAEEKAYALYRSVMCYAPSGHNDCGGEDVPEAVRKGWFQRLKQSYPTSRWAEKLRYYW